VGSGVNKVAVGTDMEAWIQSWSSQWGSKVHKWQWVRYGVLDSILV